MTTRNHSDSIMLATSNKYLLRAPKDRVLKSNFKVPRGIIIVFLSYPTKNFRHDIDVLRTVFSTEKGVEDVFYNEHPNMMHSVSYHPGDVLQDVELGGMESFTPRYNGLFKIPFKGTYSLENPGQDFYFSSYATPGKLGIHDLSKLRPHFLSNIVGAMSKNNQGKTTVVFYDGRNIKSGWWHTRKTRNAREHELFQQVLRQNAAAHQRRGRVYRPHPDLHHAQEAEELHRRNALKRISHPSR